MLFQTSLGPIYKTRVLGESMVWLHCPGCQSPNWKMISVVRVLISLSIISIYPVNVNCTGDIRTLLSKEGSMPILPSMNTFIELRQEEEYRNIFHEGTGLISQVQEQLGLD